MDNNNSSFFTVSDKNKYPLFPTEYSNLLEKSKNSTGENSQKYREEYLQYAYNFIMKNDHMWCR